MKRLLSVILILVMAMSAFSMLACDKEDSSSGSSTPAAPVELATPQNVKVGYDGTITWNAVENATGYIVTVNGEEHAVSGTSYTAAALSTFKFTVAATADGYTTSAPSEEKEYVLSAFVENITVAIEGNSTVKSGGIVKLSAKVENTDFPTVYWEIVEGAAHATVDENGIVQAKSGSGGNVIKVRATSDLNEGSYGEKTITILSAPKLTQAMIDRIASFDVIGFQGYVDIDLWTVGQGSQFANQITTPVATAMIDNEDESRWFATYTNGTTGLDENLFYKKVDNMAKQVGVSYLNTEEYYPLLDGVREVTWDEAGLYNTMKKRKPSVNDFVFDEANWMYKYVGSDYNFVPRMVASANPYEFEPKNLFLILDDKGTAINGFYSESEIDYSIASGYQAFQYLTVMYNLGTDEVGDIPSLNKFETAEWHSPLNQAIANMQRLNNESSYKMNLMNVSGSVYTSGTTISGYEEILNADYCYFRDYVARSYDGDGNPVMNFEGQNVYGYKNFSDENGGFYNAFYADRLPSGDLMYTPSRAYESDFINAKPSYAFAGEIFTSYYLDEETEDGQIKKATYYVNEYMTPVASMFYYGVGNDINMYGLFAQMGYAADTAFYPFLTVELIDGEYYITSASFYYYLGYLYGIMIIEYSDFGTAELPVEESTVTFEKKLVPASWDELVIYNSEDSNSTSDDVPVRADLFMAEYFKDPDAASKIPFFCDAIGDTYGFGLKGLYRPTGDAIMREAITLYYDVPLDIDYTINSSIEAVERLLIDNGFTKSPNGYYEKNEYNVEPVDSSLDFFIYVWKD